MFLTGADRGAAAADTCAVHGSRRPREIRLTTELLTAAVRDGIARATAAIGLAGIGPIHPLDAPSRFTENRTQA